MSGAAFESGLSLEQCIYTCEYQLSVKSENVLHGV